MLAGAHRWLLAPKKNKNILKQKEPGGRAAVARKKRS